MTDFKQFPNTLYQFLIDQHLDNEYHTIELSKNPYAFCSHRQQAQDLIVELSCVGLIDQRSIFVRF